MLNQSFPTGFFPITAENEDRCAHNSKGNVVEEAILCYCNSPPAWAGNDQHPDVYLMPGTTDQYFISEEIEEEGALIPQCVFQPLESPMGHVAESAADMQPQIEAAIGACLALAQGAPKL